VTVDRWNLSNSLDLFNSHVHGLRSSVAVENILLRIIILGFDFS
jgi:hypothetical protein